MDYYQENIERIASYIKNGEKEDNDCKLGLEAEHFIVENETCKSVGYYQENGVRDILNDLRPLYEEPIMIDGTVLGLKREDASISLEPAAQFEISIKPMTDVNQIEESYKKFYHETSELLKQYDYRLIKLGYHPVSKIEELRMVPKTRYKHMSEYLNARGQYALNMMKGTASVQVSIDYTSEDDFKEKFKLANCFSSIFAFLCDNTPIFEGKPIEKGMIRTQIWNHVDPDRSMIVPGALDHPFGYKDYAEYIYNRPAVITHIDGEERSSKQTLMKDMFSNKLMEPEDVIYNLGMFFPDVRVKYYIEIRMADSMPDAYIFAYAALIKGLFYNKRNRSKYLEIFRNVNNDSIVQMKHTLVEEDKDASVFGENIFDFILTLITDADEGLPEDEKHYLAPLKKLALGRQHIYEAEPKQCEA